MKRQALKAALVVFATLHVVVAVAPAAVLAAAARKGGLPSLHGFDLLAVSLLLGGLHASIVWHRLRAEHRAGVRFVDACIAGLHALVVLAAAVTLLLFTVLGGFAPEHAAIVNRGWEVVWLWTGLLVLAIAISELARSAVLRSLQRDRTPAKPNRTGRQTTSTPIR